MAKVDPRDFLLNTDYEMDKVIYYKDGEITPNSYGIATIAHKLPFAPLLTGVWSKTSDFTEPHAFFKVSPSYSSTAGAYKYMIDAVELQNDSTNITLHLLSGLSNNPTVYNYYVRIFGFEPSDGRNNTPATSQYAKNFILNTDYNYLKLHSKGVLPVTYSGGYPQPVTITHDLGYIPQALFWAEGDYQGAPSFIEQIDYMTTSATSNIGGQIATRPKSCVEAYNDKFIIYPPLYNGGFDSIKIHYRIYYDEAS